MKTAFVIILIALSIEGNSQILSHSQNSFKTHRIQGDKILRMINQNNGASFFMDSLKINQYDSTVLINSTKSFIIYDLQNRIDSIIGFYAFNSDTITSKFYYTSLVDSITQRFSSDSNKVSYLEYYFGGIDKPDSIVYKYLDNQNVWQYSSGLKYYYSSVNNRVDSIFRFSGHNNIPELSRKTKLYYNNASLLLKEIDFYYNMLSLEWRPSSGEIYHYNQSMTRYDSITHGGIDSTLSHTFVSFTEYISYDNNNNPIEHWDNYNGKIRTVKYGYDLNILLTEVGTPFVIDNLFGYTPGFSFAQNPVIWDSSFFEYQGPQEFTDEFKYYYSFRQPVSSLIKESSEEVKIYPNPATDYLIIEFDDFNSDTKFRLYDFQGRLQINKLLHSDLNTISLSGLPRGLYFYDIRSERQVIPITSGRGKIIKE
ncbi:T9SS type A sorting domain-containing protein [Hyphobacterium sp. CCMP332]|nr:T9SS type A sorting domain-containing protein [Hyphobacterium sp. CCMP332]